MGWLNRLTMSEIQKNRNLNLTFKNNNKKNNPNSNLTFNNNRKLEIHSENNKIRGKNFQNRLIYLRIIANPCEYTKSFANLGENNKI